MTAPRHDIEIGDPHPDEAWCTCTKRKRITEHLDDRIRVRLLLMIWAHEHQIEVLRLQMHERENAAAPVG